MTSRGMCGVNSVVFGVVTSGWYRRRRSMDELGAASALNKPLDPIIIGAVDVLSTVDGCQGLRTENVGDLNEPRGEQPELWHQILGKLRRLCYRDENS